MADEISSNNTEVFVYTEGAVVPDDVVRVRVHPTVTAIPEHTFQWRRKLEEVVLCEGLLEIGTQAFNHCKTLKRIKIPSTVTTIGHNAFSCCPHLGEVVLCCEGLVEIEMHAFSSTGLTQLRIPPLIATIPTSIVSCCRTVFSVEFLDSVMQIGDRAFFACHFLRNIALPPDAGIDISLGCAFYLCTDLLQLFDTEDQLINALKHRFDNLTVHKMIYYQSYNNVTVDQLNNATNIRISRRRSKLEPTGNRQDCLGMTPLHIMACSTSQSVELYKVLVDKYPETLLIEDRWGALPLLYAVWGDAPNEIIQYLVESYRSIYPDYELNWTAMLKTLGRLVAPMSELNDFLEDIIQKLIDIQQESFPEQNIDWEVVLNNLLRKRVYSAPLRFFVKCSIAKRVNAIGLKYFRDAIMKKVDTFLPYGSDAVSWEKRLEFLTEVQTMLTQYETKYQNLKEATSVLELVLWKNSINETMSDDERGTRKRKFGETDLREQSRVNCGADIIIRNVLPYLVLPVLGN